MRTNTTPSGADDQIRVIACALAEIDGYDPKDLNGGLYDLRWSGGASPEPEGDAWHMDYLPKAKKIAAALSAAQAAPAQAAQAVPEGWPRAAKDHRDQGWTLEYRFLERVTDLAAPRTEYSTSMEATEQVLIAALEVLAAAQAAPQPAAQQGAIDWTAFEMAVQEYIDDYEMAGETEDGRDAYYAPNENDKALLLDAFMGFDFSPWVAPAAQAQEAAPDHFPDAGKMIDPAAPAAQGEPSDARDEGFYCGVCLALQIMTGFGDAGSTAWSELLESAGREQVEHHAKHVDPDMWELAGFAHIEQQEQAYRDELEDAARASQQKGASR